MAFIDFVQDYIGTFSDTGAIDRWLTAGAKKVVDIQPTEKLKRVAVETAVLATGLDISESKIFAVHKSGYNSVEIPVGLKARITDPASLLSATETSPNHYIDNKSLYVEPGGGTVLRAVYPTVSNTDSSIPSFPTEWEQAVILYATEQAALSKAGSSLTSIAGLSIPSVSAPTPPESPSFTYTNAVTGTYTATTIAALPSLSYVAATLASYAETDIASSPTAPTYTKPTTLASYANLELYISSEEDFEKANAEIQQQTTKLREFAEDIGNEFNEFNKELSIYQAELSKIIKQSDLDQQRILKAASDETALNLQNVLNQLNADLDEYQAGVNKIIKQAELDQQRILQEASDTTELNLRNALQTTATEISQYQSSLGLYSGEIQLYGAQINKGVSELAAKIQQQATITEGYYKLANQLRSERNFILGLSI